MAQLMSQGYSGAQNTAGNVANLGLSGTGGSNSIGQYLQQLQMQQANPGIMQSQILQSGVSGAPQSTTQSTPVNYNTGAGVLGGASTGAGIGSAFGPWGTGIGAAAGGLLGLFH
jgi:hypothetical protein